MSLTEPKLKTIEEELNEIIIFKQRLNKIDTCFSGLNNKQIIELFIKCFHRKIFDLNTLIYKVYIYA